MNPAAKILGFASAAGLLAALTVPAIGQTTNTNAQTSPPSTCSNNSVSNTEPGSGTNGANTGTNTGVSSSQPNTSAPPVSPNTPANTNAANVNSNNPGAHATTQNGNPCKSTNGTNNTQQQNMNPPAMNAPVSTGTEMNALTGNPNGPNWLDKFNRPVARASSPGMMQYASGRHHKSKHRAKRASGGGGH